MKFYERIFEIVCNPITLLMLILTIGIGWIVFAETGESIIMGLHCKNVTPEDYYFEKAYNSDYSVFGFDEIIKFNVSSIECVYNNGLATNNPEYKRLKEKWYLAESEYKKK